ncbi:O-acyltransferase like protein-like [Macrosteles quadrilineatus]|uniref:O-acyltransferase like protein-like n=1 Tax=Macrosteles quadrilineatus TaxID=74068 RepID=UPI0023E1B81B|nr:O-acyltransferase like protein-like [Macrosteles quadrilineatus]
MSLVAMLWLGVLLVGTVSSGVEAINVTDLAPASELTLSEVLSWLPSATDLLRSTTDDCRTQSLQLLHAAEKLELPALQMLDSWAKFPSGILRGNINQLGDFDECMNAGGRYCLITVDLKLPSRLDDLDTRLHAHHALTSSVNDPGHRLPRWSMVNWAVCIPSACTSKHLQAALDSLLENGREQRGLVITARADAELCQAREDPAVMSRFTSLLGWSFFILIFLLCVLGTAADMISSKTGFSLQSDNLREILRAFSLTRNIRSLLNTEARQDEVAGLHGARALNAFGLLLSHKQMALMFLPYTNRTDLAQVIGKSWSMIGRTAILYTDSFILLSGILSARSFLRELRRSNSLNLVDSLISRFFRLAPSLAALIVFCSAVLPSLGSGPMWGLLVNKYASLCHSYWWRNLLFIHNHFPFTQMCLTHSHQIGIDMQLFLMAPLLVYVLWRRPSLGFLMLLAVSFWSSVLRYTVALSENLATVIYYGVPISQLFKTAEKTYILPSHRATVYCLGIALGYFFHRYKTCKLSHTTVALGWTMSALFALLPVFGPHHMSWPSYVYDPQEAALYNALAPIVWSLFVSWALFASHYGYGGWFGQLLGWGWFAVFTKLSYAVYLTQFPIFFYNVATTRTSQQYSFFTLLNITEFAVVMLASVVLTLAVDLPAQNLKKAFLPRITASASSTAKDVDTLKNLLKKTEDMIVQRDQEFTKNTQEIKERRRLPGL